VRLRVRAPPIPNSIVRNGRSGLVPHDRREASDRSLNTPPRRHARTVLLGAWFVVNVAVIAFVSGGGWAFEPIEGTTGGWTEPSVESRGDREASSRPYVVIDRNNNQLFVRQGPDVLLEAVVSTGSGDILRETSGQRRSWTFDTPPGRHRVLSKRRDPVWVKPDWAFIEAGVPIPSNLEDRTETRALGAYALDLGDGYMIHGATYERLLGRSTTHGCIRASRADLEKIFDIVPLGAPVFVFPDSDPAPNGPTTLVMDLDRQAFALLYEGTVLRTYRFSSVERGHLRLPALRGAMLDGGVPRSWSNASIHPTPVRPRREILQTEVDGRPDPAGAVAYVPSPPDSITPVPAVYRIAFGDGLTIVVESEGSDRAGAPIPSRLKAIGSRVSAFAAQTLPDRGERARLRVRMSRVEAGELYRSLPPGSRLVVMRSESTELPEQVVLTAPPSRP